MFRYIGSRILVTLCALSGLLLADTALYMSNSPANGIHKSILNVYHVEGPGLFKQHIFNMFDDIGPIVSTSDGKWVYAAIYNTSSNAASLEIIDSESQEVVSDMSFTAPMRANDLIMSPDGTKLYIVDDASDAVWVMETATRTLLPDPLIQITDSTMVWNLTLSRDGTIGYLSLGNDILKINMADGTVLLHIQSRPDEYTNYLVEARSIVLSVDERTLFTRDIFGHLIIVDTENGTITKGQQSYSIGSLLLSPTGSRLYGLGSVSGTSGLVTVDIATGNADVLGLEGFLTELLMFDGHLYMRKYAELYELFPDAPDNQIVQIAESVFLTSDCPSLMAPLTNLPPVAKITPIESQRPGVAVTLDASGSYDPDGDDGLLSFTWTVYNGGVPTTYEGRSVDFTPEVAGRYLIYLYCTDGKGFTRSNSIMYETSNSTPIADAGEDQVVTYIGTTVELNGSRSFDYDGDMLYYSWQIAQKPEGSTATLSDPAVVNPTFTADVQGEYVVTLTVSDTWLTGTTDSITVSFNNIAPLADSGGNYAAVVGETVTLDGTNSSDTNGDPLSYSWSLLTQPEGSTATLANADAPQASLVIDVNGTYVASLTVSDGLLDSEPNTAQIVAISVADATTQNVVETVETINALPDEIFSNPNLGNALTNKLNSVLGMIADGHYEQALSKLQSDILPKTDGCHLNGVPDKQDWINTCDEQEAVYDSIMEIIARLETLIAEQ